MNEPMRILIVDDEPEICATLVDILEEEGYRTATASNQINVMQQMESGADLVLLDIKLGEENGIDILKQLKAQWTHTPVIMISGHGTVSLAAKAFKLGAHDFLEKPLRLLQVRTCIRNALESVRLRKRITRQSAGNYQKPIYKSDSVKQIYRQTRKLANVKEPVVIIGPSGAGKDLVARALHFDGNRAQCPFVATNAASMPVNLAEAELFGHEKGAFTGADRQRKGCIEQANTGTLFLDEIGDMDLQIQAKLLRVLEDGTFRRLGSNQEIRADVRVICATHKNLEDCVQQGVFRHDLWYRISAFVIKVPGLSERRVDIPLLANHFLDQICADLGVVKKLSDSGLNTLENMEFPGNIRELKHLITRLAVFSNKDTIDRSCILEMMDKETDLHTNPEPGQSEIEPGNFREARKNFESSFLESALNKAQGNITAAAQMVGMAQSNLSRKLKELGIR